MSIEQLDFVTFCIGNLFIRLNLPQKVVYIKLKDSGIFDDHIVKDMMSSIHSAKNT